MERYDGEGEPPYIELILRAVSDDSPDLSLPVTLNGVKHPNNMLTLVVIPKGKIFFFVLQLSHFKFFFE